VASFNSIQSVQHIQEAAAVCEVQCALAGEFRLAELPLDRDLLSESFVEYVRANEWGDTDPEYFEQEPEACFQQASLMVVEGVAEQIRLSGDLLAGHFPFDLSSIDDGVIRLKEQQSEVGRAYLWLQVYLLRTSKHNYAQFERNDDNLTDCESHQFNLRFEKAFEYLAAFAVAGRYGSAVWITGRSRSAKTYLTMLKDICRTIGQGKVKSYGQLSPACKATNDGRADIVAITRPNGGFGPNSELYLGQATYQKADLAGKTVKNDNVTFFNKFFSQPIPYAKHGVLIVPHPYNVRHEEECENSNCIYFPLNVLLENLGKADLSFKIEEACAAFGQAVGDLTDHLQLQAI
jgi:hypothetical protein